MQLEPGQSLAESKAPRAPRADAQRNRASVLGAAEALFATDGLDVTMDAIAERAGVGVGTVYRHFPTKERLYEAIMRDRIDRLILDARERLETADPAHAFFDFVDHLVDEMLRKSDLVSAFAAARVEVEVVVGDAKQQLEVAVTDLLIAAQAAGAVRRDVSAPVVLSLIGGTCMAAKPSSEATTKELLRIVLDGLRANAATQ